MTHYIIPALLCGGSGERLWPLSGPGFPKAFQKLVGEEQTLLQQTALRFQGDFQGNHGAWCYQDPFILCATSLAETAKRQLCELDTRPACFLLEPEGRDTAAAAAAVALEVQAHAPDSFILLAPSDHYLADKRALDAAVDRLIPAVKEGKIAVFSLEADYPATGYGYIQRGAQIYDQVHTVQRFTEKPDEATARHWLAQGEHGWNAGLFLFRADTMLDALRAHAPHILHPVKTSWETAQCQGRDIFLGHEAFERLPSISLDYAVMEHVSDAVVTLLDSAWADLGDWNSLYNFEKNKQNKGLDNIVKGESVLAFDIRDCYVRAESGIKLAIMGVENLIVVAHDNGVLVCPRDKAHHVKRLLQGGKIDDHPQ